MSTCLEISVESRCILCVVVANSKSAYAPESARSTGKASIVLSVIGLIIGVICFIIVIIVQVTGVAQPD